MEEADRQHASIGRVDILMEISMVHPLETFNHSATLTSADKSTFLREQFGPLYRSVRRTMSTTVDTIMLINMYSLLAV